MKNAPLGKTMTKSLNGTLEMGEFYDPKSSLKNLICFLPFKFRNYKHEIKTNRCVFHKKSELFVEMGHFTPE